MTNLGTDKSGQVYHLLPPYFFCGCCGISTDNTDVVWVEVYNIRGEFSHHDKWCPSCADPCGIKAQSEAM